MVRLREEGSRWILEHLLVTLQQRDASECQVRLAYAPNRPESLDGCYDMTGRGKREGAEFFDHAVLAERYDPRAITRELAQGGHFFDANAPWNRQAGSLL